MEWDLVCVSRLLANWYFVVVCYAYIYVQSLDHTSLDCYGQQVTIQHEME